MTLGFMSTCFGDFKFCGWKTIEAEKLESAATQAKNKRVLKLFSRVKFVTKSKHLFMTYLVATVNGEIKQLEFQLRKVL